MSVYLLTILFALLLGQGTKVLLALLSGHPGEWRLALLRSGGMPSAHAALMVSMTTVVGATEGVHSALFGLALVITFVVMYDAVNVRRSVGEQGNAIKQLITELKLASEGYIYKQADGHRPIETLAGTATGIIAAALALYVT